MFHVLIATRQKQYKFKLCIFLEEAMHATSVIDDHMILMNNILRFSQIVYQNKHI